MKARPILFSGSMVRALLTGTKTQTRRICKPSKTVDYEKAAKGADASWFCPYGQPCDRLWVRETWCHKSDDGVIVYNKDGNLDPSCVWFRASKPDVCAMDDSFARAPTRMGLMLPHGSRPFTCPVGLRASCWKSPTFACSDCRRSARRIHGPKGSSGPKAVRSKRICHSMMGTLIFRPRRRHIDSSGKESMAKAPGTLTHSSGS